MYQDHNFLYCCTILLLLCLYLTSDYLQITLAVLIVLLNSRNVGIFRDRMTAAECLQHKWLKEPDVKQSLAVPSSVAGGSALVPVYRVPSVSDSPSGQRRALASTLTDDDESDDTLSLREPAKKCRCDIDLQQESVDRPSTNSSEDKENCVDVDKQRLSTASKLDIVDTSTLCTTPTTAAIGTTLIGGVCIDISVA